VEWKAALENGTLPDLSMFANIKGNTDMGWQKRSSGRKYDSLSGHEFIVGTETRKPIAMCVKSKFCRVCCVAKSKGIAVKTCNCRINHVDSSGSMEADALLDMVHDLHNAFRVHMTHICTDDDSTMRARLKWSNQKHFDFYGDWPQVLIKKGKKKGQYRIRIGSRGDSAEPFNVPAHSHQN